MSSSTVEQIKERLSIVDVVSSYIKLEKAGQNFKACCPFHNEKTPSFTVSPLRGTYHCFGCGKGGDIFSFVQDIEGEDFRSVLEKLAERAGVTIEKFTSQNNAGNARLYKLLDDATRFFEVNLYRDQSVKDYLVSRGLIEESVRNFRLGFAENSWNGLVDYLKKHGYGEEEMIETGLAIKGERGVYDRFRSRIMFPINDTQGRVVGFSGRIFGEIADDKTQAKYVNSPETTLYNKSRLLFGYDKAKQMIMRTGFVVIVEGQMDLIMSHQAGVANTVAVSGTALTVEHLNLIRRFADRLIFAFDADPAGLKAAHRSATIALPLGFDVRFLQLPTGIDPAEYIKEDKEAFHKALNEAPSVAEFYLSLLKSTNKDTRDFRLAVGKELLPLIALVENKIDQAHFIKRISEETGLPEISIREELVKSLQDSATAMPARVIPKSKTKDHLVGLMLWQKDNPLHLSWEEDFQKVTGMPYGEFLASYSEDRQAELIFEAEYTYTLERAPHVVSDLLRKIEHEDLTEKRDLLDQQIKEAEKENDEEDAKKLLLEFQTLSKRLEDLRRHPDDT